ncbi:MAG: hypothetical protein K8W52_32565 [Deltaproteobacteria bacterium]|nr:hypothetical protein [Deltaproteobacteria bacterium]
MSLPRQVLPGTYYMLTRRCTQRQFLLRPDSATNNTFLYCLADAAQRFEIDVILPSVMSNHHHTIVFDRHGRIVEFIEHLHKFVAKAMNALRGRRENFWSSEAPCVVRLVDRADILDKLVYAATNPVKDRLVDRVHHWPGVNGLSALLNQRPIVVARPRHFFRTCGSMPAALTLHLVIPPELGDGAEVRRGLRARIADVEEHVELERARTGAPVLGRRAVSRQSWRDQATSVEPRGGINPRVAARSRWARREALLRDRTFLDLYREARGRWVAGEPATFPLGTYWLHRFARVPIEVAATR